MPSRWHFTPNWPSPRHLTFVNGGAFSKLRRRVIWVTFSGRGALKLFSLYRVVGGVGDNLKFIASAQVAPKWKLVDIRDWATIPHSEEWDRKKVSDVVKSKPSICLFGSYFVTYKIHTTFKWSLTLIFRVDRKQKSENEIVLMYHVLFTSKSIVGAHLYPKYGGVYWVISENKAIFFSVNLPGKLD